MSEETKDVIASNLTIALQLRYLYNSPALQGTKIAPPNAKAQLSISEDSARKLILDEYRFFSLELGRPVPQEEQK
jgi:hypothetical protein